MTGIANNPARIALLTEMEDQLDDGAKLWEEQPATRNSTKNALLRDGYVAILKGGKAYITEKGREAVAALAAKGQTSQVALEAGTPTKGEEAKAKFEAARSKVVKPAKAEKPAKPQRAAASAKKPEARTEPAQQAEQPAPVAPTEEGKAKVEAPAKWVMTKRTEAGWQPSAKDKLSAIIQDVYGVNYYHAPAIALIWAASQFADLEGIEAAREALTEINREREEAGKPIAVPPYGSKLF